MSLALSAAELREFSPDMEDGYLRALTVGGDALLAAGILANGRRLSHFFGQFGAETNGGQILRESLTYTSVKAIRGAWRARASKHSDDWIKANLLRKPIALGDWAYGGRMGNRKGTSDGFDFRGGGFLQTTGRSAVHEYCQKCGIELRPDTLDDFDATLQFACIEWKESGCNALADANDILGISKAINTGSAKSKIVPNGMDNREHWFGRARDIWWDAEETEAEPGVVDPPSVPSAQKDAAEDDSKGITFDWLIEQGSRVAKVIETARKWFWAATGVTAAGTAGVAAAKKAGVSNGTIEAAGSVAHDHHLVILYVVIGVLVVGLAALICLLRRYLLTAAKDGRYKPRGRETKVA